MRIIERCIAILFVRGYRQVSRVTVLWVMRMLRPFEANRFPYPLSTGKSGRGG